MTEPIAVRILTIQWDEVPGAPPRFVSLPDLVSWMRIAFERKHFRSEDAWVAADETIEGRLADLLRRPARDGDVALGLGDGLALIWFGG